MTEKRAPYGPKIIYRVTVTYRTTHPTATGKTEHTTDAPVKANNASEALRFHLERLERTHHDINNVVAVCSIDHEATANEDDSE